MNKLLAIIVLAMFIPMGLSATDVSGEIENGFWTTQNSPYHVVGDITVASLAIEAGVEVVFDGNYSFTVNGELHAKGSKTDSIVFKNNPSNSSGWKGIRFENTAANSELSYCRISGANSAAIRLNNSAPLIDKCAVFNNSASGLEVTNGQSTLYNCFIRNNDGQGVDVSASGSVQLIGCSVSANGQNGININNGKAFLENVIIAHNNQQGIFLQTASDELDLTNCVVANNSGTGIFCGSATATVQNSILYNNTTQIGGAGGQITVNYSNVQGGYDGTGNITQDPRFADTVDFTLTEDSPSIDNGNPDSSFDDCCFPPSLGGIRNDMGAYGGPLAFHWFNPLFIQPQMINFGDVTRDSLAREELLIKNYSKKQLTIFSSLITGNDADGFSIENLSRQLSPFDSLLVDVSFQPARTGFHEATATFSSNAGTEAIPLSGNGIISDIFVSPDLLDFKDVLVGESSKLSVNIFNTGSDSLRVSAVSTTNSDFLVNKNTSVIPPFQSDSLTVTFEPDSLNSYSDTLLIVSNDPDPEENPYKVILNGRGVGPLMATDSSQINFKRIRVGQSYERSFSISNPGSAALTIDSLNLGGPYARLFNLGEISLPLHIEPGAPAQTVSITFNPDSIGIKQATLSIVSSDPFRRSFSLPLAGEGIASEITVNSSPDGIDFGSLLVSADSLVTIQISNTGNASMQIDTLRISGADPQDFSVSAGTLPVSIPAGGNALNATIRFKPKSDGLKSAILQIASDDPYTDTLRINLSGRGIAPHIAVSGSGFDFGPVWLLSDSTRQLTVSNTGSADLILSSYTISGPDDPVFTFSGLDSSLTLAPQSAGQTFSLSFNPDSRGSKNATLRIFSNDPEKSPSAINLTGLGVAAAIQADAGAFDFAEVIVDSVKNIVTHLKNPGNADLIISRMEIDGPSAQSFKITGDPGQLTVPADGDSLPLQVSFTPKAESGASARLRLISNAFEQDTLDFALSGSGVVPALSVDTLLHFGSVDLDSSALAQLEVSNPGSGPLTIFDARISGTDSAQFQLENLTLPLVLEKDGSSRLIDIRFIPRLGGDKTAWLNLTSNARGNESVSIHLTGSGNVTDQPLLVTSAQNGLDFGDVLITNSAAQSISFSNFGDVDLRIDSLHISGPDSSDYNLAAPSLPIILTPEDDPKSVELSFSPSSEGLRNAGLMIFSNDLSQYPALVELKGMGRIDSTPAEITIDTSALQFVSGENFEMSVQISDDETAITSLKLFIRAGAKSAYDELPFTPKTNTLWTVEIDSSLFTERGLEYYLEAAHGGRTTLFPDNGKNNPAAARVTVKMMSFPQSTHLNLYQKISCPLSTEGQSLSDLFLDNLGPYDSTLYRIFDWDADAESFIELDDMQNGMPSGKALWLITREQTELSFTNGKSVKTNHNFEIALEKGWNMIAVPFAFAVDWQQVQQSVVQGNQLFYYDGLNWAPANRLEPFKGYAVYAAQAGTLTIPPIEANTQTSKQMSTVLEEGEWHIKISASKKEYADACNYAGVRLAADDNWDMLEMKEPPVIGPFVSLVFDKSNWPQHPGNYTSDLRSAGQDSYRFAFKVRSNFSGSTELSLEPTALPENLDWVVISEQKKIRYPRGNISSSLKDQEYQLLIGTQDYLSQALSDYREIPKDFRISQNYPNPFNPTTQISYQIPEARFVSATVFDILGRKIKTLIRNRFTEPGYYKVQWNGTNEARQPVASGLYLLNIRTGKNTKTIKMVLQR